ncbi:RING-H2 finger protein ATL80-like [Mercurialis annua]|uniref:RING-H2 finger protein ATL80-like n=1 Tax=Mercurialis annua TaxID=3986 RepID=UPI0021606A9B|nr:RING-H2 finger protein ATL80-like [Mercurialis annua]
MARFTRMLTGFDSTPAAEPANVESDLVVIMAALLCAIVCVVGLIAVARCAWLRRSSSASSSPPSQAAAAANKGVKKKVLQSLPKFTYGSAAVAADSDKFASTECAICLGEFAAGDEVRVLPQCGHGFHVGCIDTWLKSHSSCPSCRRILVTARCQKCGLFPAISPSASSCAVQTHSKTGESNNNRNSNSSANANANASYNNNHHQTVIAGFLP